MTKNEWIEKLKKELRLLWYAQSTIDTYSGCLSVILSKYHQYNGYKNIDDIKNFMLTINNQNYDKTFRATFHHFFKLVLKRPISLDDLPYPRKTHFLPSILSVQESDRLINATNNIKHRCILQLLYSVALRISEPLNIEFSNQIRHIDFDRKELLVKAGKGYKDRIVPLPFPTLVLVNNYYKQYKPQKFLFEGQKGDRYTARSIQQIFHAAKIAANIYKRVTPHSLRHSRATHLCEAGMDIYKIKEMLGHNNIKTTEMYLHLSKQSLGNNIANADAIIAQAMQGNKELMLELSQ